MRFIILASRAPSAHWRKTALVAAAVLSLMLAPVTTGARAAPQRVTVQAPSCARAGASSS